MLCTYKSIHHLVCPQVVSVLMLPWNTTVPVLLNTYVCISCMRASRFLHMRFQSTGDVTAMSEDVAWLMHM